ncbi:hypothetical protein EVAR_75924_1 [Eumeta japonica]|uniref:Uncharacterized protein n=1 Tax=Eumeta variegata TaxID=151549 RepID=A0A4C1UW43_EUMVA|nr:hypothetical protein EVAR_75924_1 [Eumeta japonica]
MDGRLYFQDSRLVPNENNVVRISSMRVTAGFVTREKSLLVLDGPSSAATPAASGGGHRRYAITHVPDSYFESRRFTPAGRFAAHRCLFCYKQTQTRASSAGTAGLAQSPAASPGRGSGQMRSYLFPTGVRMTAESGARRAAASAAPAPLTLMSCSPSRFDAGLADIRKRFASNKRGPSRAVCEREHGRGKRLGGRKCACVNKYGRRGCFAPVIDCVNATPHGRNALIRSGAMQVERGAAGTRHAQSALVAAPPPPARFTFEEWQLSNSLRSRNADDQQQLAERVLNAARGRPIIVEWERDARHSAGLSRSVTHRYVTERYTFQSDSSRNLI